MCSIVVRIDMLRYYYDEYQGSVLLILCDGVAVLQRQSCVPDLTEAPSFCDSHFISVFTKNTILAEHAACWKFKASCGVCDELCSYNAKESFPN